MKNNEKLKEFKEALERMDWYYMMSDDHRWYKEGRSRKAELDKMAINLTKEGLGEEAKELWYEIAPDYPYTNNKFEFPKT